MQLTTVSYPVQQSSQNPSSKHTPIIHSSPRPARPIINLFTGLAFAKRRPYLHTMPLWRAGGWGGAILIRASVDTRSQALRLHCALNLLWHFSTYLPMKLLPCFTRVRICICDRAPLSRSRPSERGSCIAAHRPFSAHRRCRCEQLYKPPEESVRGAASCCC